MIGAGSWLWVFHRFMLGCCSECWLVSVRPVHASRAVGCVRCWRTEAERDAKGDFPGLRHTSTPCAIKHTLNAALVKQLGRIKPVFLLVFGEEELCDSHSQNQMHEPMAARALP